MPELKNKRTVAAEGANKKMKLNNPLTAKLTAIEKAFGQVSDVPEPVRKMLVESFPLSLGKPQNERHPFQVEVVNVIGKVLNSALQGLEGEIIKFQEQVDSARSIQTAKAEESIKEQEKLEEKEEVTKQRIRELAAVAQDFRVAKSAFQEAKAKQQREDAELEKAEKKKQQMEAAVQDMINPLSVNPVEGANTGKMIDGLIKFLHASEFEESLITALKPALHKAPSDRGEFDLMCFKELNDEVSKRIAELEAVLSSGEAGKQERAAAVQAAEESLTAAREKQNAAAAMYTSAKSEQEEVNNMVNTINQASRDLGQQVKSITRSLSSAKTRLDVFNKGPMANFQELEGTKVVEVVMEEEVNVEEVKDEAMTEAA